MKNETRVKFDQYLSRQAELNHVSVGSVMAKFSVDPSITQTLENRIQESSEFLTRINISPVSEQEGEKLGLGVDDPIASTTDTTVERRQPASVESLDSGKYRCEQTNSDTFIRYARLDAWAKFKDFQARVTNQIVKRRGLDRIMIGLNGVTRAAKSNKAQNPLLQDVNVGWLQKYRLESPQRVLAGKTITSRDQDNAIIATGDYGNLDALAYDAVNSLIDPWFQDDTDLVVICGRNLLSDRYFPILNTLSKTNPNTEALAGKVLLSQQQIGAMPTYRVPYFPPNAMLITRFDNLSIYWQEDTHRRMIKDEPEWDRIATYESSNDAYVVEDYGCGCLIEDITPAE
ncbi:phage major capsid protein, P2 family [Serratia fonticola]|uniref:phage major capsid protein, P2 family n=1 Tax=Serratia fonticola TaxID=47917 RepID=UPI00192A8246|nr:phage major capsid protein, P2 family [Serratia fonticola]MBL5864424.1 phage major capsid protein, P2 family [Serratia fonticola]